MNEMMINFTAAIDNQGQNFRNWYSFITIPTTIADISIKVVESFLMNMVSDVLNMKFSDIFGTADIMSMKLKTFLFIVIYR